MRAAAVAALLLLVPGCGDAGRGPRVDPLSVPASAFSGGTCLVLAEELLLVRAFSGQTLVDDPGRAALDPSSAVLLEEEAVRFRQGLRLASEQVRGPLTAFVEAMDVVSARLAAGTYDDPALLQRVVDTQDLPKFKIM